MNWKLVFIFLSITLLDFVSLPLAIRAAACIFIRDVLFIPAAIMSATSTLRLSIFSSIILLILRGLDIAVGTGATLMAFSSILFRSCAYSLLIIWEVGTSKVLGRSLLTGWLILSSTLINLWCLLSPTCGPLGWTCFCIRCIPNLSEAFSNLCLK